MSSYLFNHHYHSNNPKIRVPTAQGKQGKWQKKNPVREITGNLKILSKLRENTGNFVSSSALILKEKDIAIFAAKKSIFSQKLDWSAKSVLCM